MTTYPAKDPPAAPGAPAVPGGPAGEVHDEVLLDDPNTADLKAKVSTAWKEFARSLAVAIPALPPGVGLDLILDPTASGTGHAVYAVSVVAGEEGELAAYAVGNAGLPEGYRLKRDEIAALIALGWAPPGVVEGSGERFGLRASADEAARVAAIIARTMRDLYGAPHPAFLTYVMDEDEDEDDSKDAKDSKDGDDKGDKDGKDGKGDKEPRPEIPRLAGARPETSGPTPVVGTAPPAAVAKGPLGEKVRTVVAALLKTEADQLEVDNDGDIGIRAGSAMVFVRVNDNPPLVDVYSPVLTEVQPSQKLYAKLSELTRRMPIGRLYCTDDTVWASVPVFGRDFQASHLMLAVQVMTGLADELDDRLHGEFGGKRFFGEDDKPASRAEDPRTGMYL